MSEPIFTKGYLEHQRHQALPRLFREFAKKLPDGDQEFCVEIASALEVLLSSQRENLSTINKLRGTLKNAEHDFQRQIRAANAKANHYQYLGDSLNEQAKALVSAALRKQSLPIHETVKAAAAWESGTRDYHADPSGLLYHLTPSKEELARLRRQLWMKWCWSVGPSALFIGIILLGLIFGGNN
ncbi:hypothetical protein ACD578_25670 [Microvirga sp. RSM25]|uniref:hypothetical protein n=1 Tax=Microvirga sp. RSM25 TaxID=3273802 RepID=UPI00384B566B